MCSNVKIMTKKKVILTFDYELFFGDKSGTVKKTLIEPTEKLMHAMENVGFRGTFFIDYPMLVCLKKQNDVRCVDDLMSIENQIRDMVRRGHRIELHIHPHWWDAKYNGDGTWDFADFRHYSLNSFSEDKIVDMFKEGVDLLTNIARQVDPFYKIVAFRAGGWAVQPFDSIKKAMHRVGLRMDSSVMPKRAIKCDYSSCDFLEAPDPNCGYYHFNNDVCIEAEGGDFIEIPITSIKRKFFSRAVSLIYRMLGICSDRIPLTDGTHKRTKDNPDMWIDPEGRVPCTFSVVIPLCVPISCLESKYDLLCYIDHPKDFSKLTIKGIKMLSFVADSITYKDLLLS